MLNTKNGLLRAFVYTAGKRIGNEFPLERGIDDADQSVMDNPIGEWRRLDEPNLRLLDDELALLTRRPGLPDEVILQVGQILFEVDREAHHL